jgi:hypothetical protein
LKFLDTHVGNILFVDDMPYKSTSNDLCSVVFWKLFEGSCSDGDDLFSIVFPYLVSLHSFGFNVHTYIRHNPFGIIRSINRNDFYYNMLFEDYSDSCEPTYYTKEKLKKKM